MTEQLERDLTELFARRAEATDAPPIPASLLAGEPDSDQHPRRTIAIGLVAAAAVAAVAVPLGLALRDDDEPAPAPQPDAPPSLELPYLHDGALHVDGLVLPTTGTSLVVAGDGVLVATAEAEGRGLTWERFDGDSLEAVPWLDGRHGAVVSYDGELVAAPIGIGAEASLRVWDADSGEVVDAVDLESAPSGEDVWLRGFDSRGHLFWEDGGIRMRTAEGAELDVRAGGRLLAAVLASGVVFREGDAEDAFVAFVSRDGKVGESFHVPVSTTAAWSAEGPVAYVPIGEPEIVVWNPGADTAPVTLPVEGPAQLAGWSGTRVVVVLNATDASETNRVVLVEPVTGEVEEVFTYGWDDPYPFASLDGTGAL